MSKIKIVNSKTGYNLAADYYANKEKYWDSFEKDRVLSMLGDLKDKKVLDVGAGTGRLALRIAHAGAQVTALDVSGEMLKNLKSKVHKVIKSIKLPVETASGEAENLPFADESFDVVIATFLVVHLKDLRRFFDETYRVLNNGGLFLVTNINQRKAPAIKTKDGLIEIESYYHRPEAVVELLEELAFSVEKNEFVKEGENWVNQIILSSK
ncbi:MAG: class I SAM-dependent methyltransferase [Candidatus Magasanikbacteria bacterium]|nr:class I SAM-dependent methyltransferase [Candidatus Magasanikbacteria bacterium]